MSGGVSTSSMVHRERLAARLMQNWAALHPHDSAANASNSPMSFGPTVVGIRQVHQRVHTQPTVVASATPPPLLGQKSSSAASVSSDQNIDDSLTSLAWLQNLNVMKLAASAASSSTVGQSRCGGFTTGPEQPYQHNVTRPTGAVHPIQSQQPRRTSTSSMTSSCSVQRQTVDPNDVLDMSYAMTSCQSIKTEPEITSSLKCESPMADPSFPPRLSPQPSGDQGFGCDSLTGSSPSPPDLQVTCNGTGSTAAKPGYSYATLICMVMNDAVENRVTLAEIYNWIMKNFPYYRTADLSWQVTFDSLPLSCVWSYSS